MNAAVTIVPYGSLRHRLPEDAPDRLDPMSIGGRPLADVLAALGLAVDQVQLAMVNHKAAAMETAVQAGERIALFSREYRIFADWQTYRRPLKG
jgi:hypothetical protein